MSGGWPTGIFFHQQLGFAPQISLKDANKATNSVGIKEAINSNAFTNEVAPWWEW